MEQQYSEEFKREAVRLVIQGNRIIREVEDELGVSFHALKYWKSKYRKEEESDLISKGYKMTPEEEIRILKKEIADVTEERDILKKAIAVFSKKPKLNIPS